MGVDRDPGNHTAGVIPGTERCVEQIRNTLGRDTKEDNLVPNRLSIDLPGEQIGL